MDWKWYDYSFTLDLFLTGLRYMRAVYADKTTAHIMPESCEQRVQWIDEMFEAYDAYKLDDELNPEAWKRFWQLVSDHLADIWD